MCVRETGLSLGGDINNTCWEQCADHKQTKVFTIRAKMLWVFSNHVKFAQNIGRIDVNKLVRPLYDMFDITDLPVLPLGKFRDVLFFFSNNYDIIQHLNDCVRQRQ